MLLQDSERCNAGPPGPAPGKPFDGPGPVDGLRTSWSFEPSSTGLSLRLHRLVRGPVYARPRPPHLELRPVVSRPRWVVYFVYLPDGRLQASHRFTLASLRRQGLALCVVCATPKAGDVPPDLHEQADALYWKGLSGYDFSAYTLALEMVALRSPGADVLVMNDSVFGPFRDLGNFMDAAPWDLTGFTASALCENHLQSYAFVLRRVTPDRLEQLRPVFPRHKAYDRMGEVVLCQELQLARVAARHMSVGAWWYNDARCLDDPCLQRPFELLDAGFPFLKKSLLGKMGDCQDPRRVIEYLRCQGHPVEA